MHIRKACYILEVKVNNNNWLCFIRYDHLTYLGLVLAFVLIPGLNGGADMKTSIHFMWSDNTVGLL